MNSIKVLIVINLSQNLSETLTSPDHHPTHVARSIAAIRRRSVRGSVNRLRLQSEGVLDLDLFVVDQNLCPSVDQRS